MIKINLLPSNIVEKKKKRDFFVFAGVCAGLAFLLCYLFYLSLSQTIYPLENKLTRLKGRIAKYQPVLKEIQNIEEENNKLQVRLDTFREIVVRQSFWPKLLYGIYRSLPDVVWLEEIKGDAEKNFIEVKGGSLNKTIGVAEFIKNMESSKFFSEIKFAKFSRQEVSGKQIMFFQLKCFLSENKG